MTPIEWISCLVEAGLPFPPKWTEDQIAVSWEWYRKSMDGRDISVIQAKKQMRHQRELEAAVIWERRQIMKMITSLDSIHAQALREDARREMKQGCIVIEHGIRCGEPWYYPQYKYCLVHYKRWYRTGNPLGQSTLGWHHFRQGPPRIGWSTKLTIEFAKKHPNGFKAIDLASHLNISTKNASSRISSAIGAGYIIIVERVKQGDRHGNTYKIKS